GGGQPRGDRSDEPAHRRARATRSREKRWGRACTRAIVVGSGARSIVTRWRSCYMPPMTTPETSARHGPRRAQRVHLGLGANLGDRLATLRAVAGELHTCGHVVAR